MAVQELDGIYFDLDGTLTDYESSAREGLRAVYDLLGDQQVSFTEFEKVTHFIMEQESRQTSETGIRLPAAENRKRRFLKVFELLGIENFKEPGAIAAAYSRGRSRGAILYPGVREMLSILAEQVDLGVITEGAVDTQMAQLENQKIAEFFQKIVISGATPYHKPSLDLYRLAVRKMATRADRIMMVGDRLDWDIVPAKQVGMKTVYFQHDPVENPGKKTREYCDFIIRNIRDVLPLVFLD